jgi:hypothetical protein
MSDEFDHSPESNFSAFWPLLILILAFIGFFAFQDYQLNRQRVAYSTQFADPQFQSAMTQADNVSARYVALMKDLVDTAQKDPAAADIVKAAIAANLIHVQPNATNSAAATPPPADSSATK